MKRESNFDLLRIVSTFAVILLHSNWIYFGTVFETGEHDITWVTMSLINIITRFSVPCFVMLSGAFILKKPSSCNCREFYKRSAKKIFIPTIVAICIFCIVQIILNISEGNRWHVGLRGVVSGNFYSLWFIYMLAGLYLLTPIVCTIRKTISWKDYKKAAYIMLLWAVISQATSTQRLAYSLGVCFAFLSYYMLGDIIKTERNIAGRINKTWILVLISALAIVTTFIWRAMGHNYYIESAYINFFSPTIVIFSLCVFCFVSRINTSRDFSFIAGITFEIYLFHRLVLKGLTPAVKAITDSPLIGIGILTVGTCVIAGVIAIVYKTVIGKMLNAK